MKFDILTLFPESFSYLDSSMLKRGKEKGLLEIRIHNLRDWATDKHGTVDDHPFGGGVGMLIKVEPVYRALKDLGVYPNRDEKTKVFLTSPKGSLWTQKRAVNSKDYIDRIVLICGHYEGFDHRITDNLIDEEISIGNYILSGGELPAMIVIDSIARLIDGVLGNSESPKQETSFEEEVYPEHPQYTRPSVFKTDEGEEWGVPEILLSGDHAKIANWKANPTKI
jgi:tRNA (guanine37-N1)-methyltransferase